MDRSPQLELEEELSGWLTQVDVVWQLLDNFRVVANWECIVMFKTILPLAVVCMFGSADFASAVAMPIMPDSVNAAAHSSNVQLARFGGRGGGRGGARGGGFAGRGGGGGHRSYAGRGSVAHRGYGVHGGGMRYGGRYGYGGRYAGRYGWGAAAAGAAVGAAAAGAYHNNNGCYYDSYGRWVCP
jgi:hypothetical protein